MVEKHDVVSGPVGARAARALGFLQYDVEDIFPLEDAVIVAEVHEEGYRWYFE